MTEEERDEAEAKMIEAVAQKALDKLGEHFENVQIFLNRNVGNGTAGIVIGKGNVFAREGQVKAWLENGGLTGPDDDCDCEDCCSKDGGDDA